jgi:hypothetical protein
MNEIIKSLIEKLKKDGKLNEMQIECNIVVTPSEIKNSKENTNGKPK